MDSYALYNFEFCPVSAVEGDLFSPQDVKVDMSTQDKNLWLDRLFGDRNTDVRIQHLKKNRTITEKFPCKVLAHGKGRVVWLRLENEKMKSIWVKRLNALPHEPETISKEDVADNPFSYIFLDCREGKNLIAIMKTSDAWRNTDLEANILQDSLNFLMQDNGYGFGIKIKPAEVMKDYWDYNRQLIMDDKKRVKKMTIYFVGGTLDPRVQEIISNTPILRNVLKTIYESKRGKLELIEPNGRGLFYKRRHDFENIIKLILSNLTNDNFGLSLAYDGGQELVCGKNVKLTYVMKGDIFSMFQSEDLFGDFPINKWLDEAAKYINDEKNGTTAKPKRKRKAPKHVQDTSNTLELF